VELSEFLNVMAAKKASDVFLSAGAPPSIKIQGETFHLGETPLRPEQVHDMAYSIMAERQQKEFESTLEMNLALAMGDIGRFRVNIYRQRGQVAMALRYITSDIPSIEQLHLPVLLKDLVMLPRGLVLAVGSTGSGKSTTLASMIDHRNRHRTGHILTVEEPIEYLHLHKQSVVDQREVGLDTLSYANALKNAMREAPDVIMIGEIRDRETMQAAVSYAETGHLCLSTLHANNANQAMERVINMFPSDLHRQLFMDLSLNLRGVISQRLVRDVNGKRVAAIEILINTPHIAELILKGEFNEIKAAMRDSGARGMQTFDDALYVLYKDARISLEEALVNADSRTNLEARINFG
jgi:twitching motility protein PilU